SSGFCLVCARGSNPNANNPGALPQVAIQPLVVGGSSVDFLTISLRRQLGAEDITYHIEFSNDLIFWSENRGQLSSTLNGDGTVTELWRAASPVAADLKSFVRLRITAP